jgi:hypothetical protein
MIFGEIPDPGAVGVSLVLLVAAFCWCWRLRYLRKTVTEIERQRHDQRVELLREYGNLLSQARLNADDLPLIAQLERVEPPDELQHRPRPDLDVPQLFRSGRPAPPRAGESPGQHAGPSGYDFAD